MAGTARDQARGTYIAWLKTIEKPTPIEAETSFLEFFSQQSVEVRTLMLPWRRVHLELVEKYSSWQMASVALSEPTLFAKDYSTSSVEILNWVIAYKQAQSVFSKAPRQRGRRGQGQSHSARTHVKQEPRSSSLEKKQPGSRK